MTQAPSFTTRAWQRRKDISTNNDLVTEAFVEQPLRLNADLADTAIQKSLRQFGNYCWPKLKYAKIYILISNTFSMLKLTRFCKKVRKMLLSVPKMVNFMKNSLKKLGTLFVKW